MISKRIVANSLKPTIWDTGNKVLYDLCSKYPSHDSDDEIIAKVWLVGRSYAAAIERRNPSEEVGDGFYINHVAPKIRKSKIDKWLKSIKRHKKLTKENFQEIMATHKRVTDLFSDISGMEKRSLASKYLHFHNPSLFYIYDSRACRGLSKLSDITGRASRAKDLEADNEYRKFAEKCLSVRRYIENKFDVFLSPRQIDNVLLYAQRHL